MNKDNISFVIPSRNNLRYFKWAYSSIRKNAGNDVYICAADDASTDGTSDYFKELATKDKRFKYIINDTGVRIGHTILYDKIVLELVTTEIFGIWHADMYLCPGAVESILKYIKPKSIVSLTRIEPPLHPNGVEKVLKDCGLEPEGFDEHILDSYLNQLVSKYKDRTTKGIFAPWFMYKEDFIKIHMHDPLFAPQSKEDSCIFNRMKLANYNFIQTWEGYTYHLTCRGSRFNPGITNVGKNSSEWEIQNRISSRNFIRKFGSYVCHDEFMLPIVKNKYNIGFIVKNCNQELLDLLEPHCFNIYMDCEYNNYIQNEQKNTYYNLSHRIKNINIIPNNDIVISFDGKDLDLNRYRSFIRQLPDILKKTGKGKYENDIFIINIRNKIEYQSELLNINNNIENTRLY